MDQYKTGKNGEVQKVLEWFNGGAISSNRTENVGFIASSCINIIGGIQPSKMKLIINEDSLSDGFSMRFLFVELPAVPLYKTRDKPNKDLTNNMLKLFKSVDEYPETIFTISPEADEIEFQYYNKQVKENFSNTITRGINSKLVGYYLYRFCIIIEVLEQAENGKKGTIISAETMKKGIKLVEFFREQIIKQYEEIIGDFKEFSSPLSKEPKKARELYCTLNGRSYTTAEITEIFKDVWASSKTVNKKLKNPELFTWIENGRYKKAYTNAK